jgi:hypothetical protein
MHQLNSTKRACVTSNAIHLPSSRILHYVRFRYLAKPFSTVCTDPFYGQTSGPRRPKFSQADPKLDVESRLPKKIGEKKFHEKNS